MLIRCRYCTVQTNMTIHKDGLEVIEGTCHRCREAIDEYVQFEVHGILLTIKRAIRTPASSGDVHDKT